MRSTKLILRVSYTIDRIIHAIWYISWLDLDFKFCTILPLSRELVRQQLTASEVHPTYVIYLDHKNNSVSSLAWQRLLCLDRAEQVREVARLHDGDSLGQRVHGLGFVDHP